MKRQLSLPRLQEVVRARICNNCERRTPGSDNLPLAQARSCEHGCGSFEALPGLRTLAVHLDPVVGNFDRAAGAVFGGVVATTQGQKVMATLKELTGR